MTAFDVGYWLGYFIGLLMGAGFMRLAWKDANKKDRRQKTRRKNPERRRTRVTE